MSATTGGPRTKRQLSRAIPNLEPAFVEPMKCRLVSELPTKGKWLYELKFDGFRALGLKWDSKVQLLSRNRKDLAGKFPEIVESLKSLPCKTALLDGEVVSLDERGRPCFEALQNAPAIQDRRSLYYYVFDLLNLDGKDLKGLPLTDRRTLLEGLLEGPLPHLRFSNTFQGDPHFLLEHVRKENLEGIIGKQADSRYEAGQRSGAWIKYKCNLEQEFVIGGCTLPQGNRPYFGSLIVGYYEHGQLHYASNVGTGFSHRQLEQLYGYFQKSKLLACPFVNLPQRSKGRWGQGLTAADMKSCVWVRPELVCQVRFTEWTAGGHLRHPSFIGLRDDKSAQEVVREQAA